MPRAASGVSARGLTTLVRSSTVTPARVRRGSQLPWSSDSGMRHMTHGMDTILVYSGTD